MEMSGLIMFEDKAEYLPGPLHVVIERPIDQLDLGDLVVHEQLQVACYALHGI